MRLINNSSDLKDTGGKKIKSKQKNYCSKIFLGYQSLENKFQSSACFGFISFLKQKLSWLGRLKHSISDMTERSKVCAWISLFFDNLLSVPMRSYGILVFFFGISSLLADILRLSSSNFIGIKASLFTMLFKVILFFSVSAFMTISSKSLGNAIINSRIVSRVLFDILNFNQKNITIEAKNYNNTIFVLLGFFLGILSIFVRIQYILFLILTLIIIYTVIKDPESGIILTILLLPFVGDTTLFVFALLCCISVFFKVMRNKRVMKIAVPDIFVFLLSAVLIFTLFNGIRHVGNFNLALKLVLLLIFGWIVNNTIKTTALAEKCVNAFVLSVSVAATVGIVISLLDIYGFESNSIVLLSIANIFRELPLSCDVSYVHLAIIGLPFAFSLYKRSRFKGLVSSILCVALIFLSFDISSWISLVVTVVLYFSIISPVLFLYFGVVFSILAVLYKLFPAFFTVVVSFINSVTNYNEYVYSVSSSGKLGLDSISRFMFSGAGIGDSTMSHVFKCLFGFEFETFAECCPIYVRVVFQVGLIGLLILLILYCLVLSNCLSLFYKDKICNNSLKHYVISCATACSVIVVSGFYFIENVSTNVILAAVLIMYLSFIFRKCSEIEFTPEDYDIDSYRDVV